MVERVFFDSIFKYTDPIRYFKANDPIYWEVDNIPLKQLMENCNFLKGQIEGILGASGSVLEFSRSNFSELKPYVDGTDNIVKVKPGRFSARINDAYSITPLQFITQVLGSTYPEINTWETKTNLDTVLKATLDKFKSTLAADALNTNGLIERVFTFPMQTQDNPSQFLSNQPGYLPNSLLPSYPNYTSKLWRFNTNDSTGLISQYFQSSPDLGFLVLGNAEADFVKRWRGITRTSIVNVENEISIEIPAFDENDFYYIDEQGVKTLVPATQRIDLVFIYSKPIDASSTTISKFSGNNPTVINKPTLGIVKGAGIGVNLKRPIAGQPATDEFLVSNVDSNGNPIILPSVADENATNIGFSSIKGSFPSPDDLMNLSPLICENLSIDNFALIGQSVLPVAYVVVRKSASLNSNNVSIIQTSDLIDIRPFFRTTELSYNERAGIAAATPQISIVNPVASEGYVDKALLDVYSDYTFKINQLNNQSTQSPQFPRVIGSGYIKGGFKYGVEGTLANFIEKKFNISNTDTARLKQEISSRYGLPFGSIFDLPDWDIAEWCNRGSFTQKGEYPNDRINFHFFGPSLASYPQLEFGAMYSKDGVARIPYLGVDRVQGTQSSTDSGNSCIYFVKKRIQIDRSNVQWMQDYHVDAQLWNCAPLSCRTHKDGNNMMVAGHASIWIDKKPTEFTIFVSWVAADQYNQAISAGSTEPGNANVRPDLDRDNGARFAGFSIINSDIVAHDYIHRVVDGESSAGVAIYPTLTFQVYGIPNGWAGNVTNLINNNPTIILR